MKHEEALKKTFASVRVFPIELEFLEMLVFEAGENLSTRRENPRARAKISNKRGPRTCRDLNTA